MREPVRKLFALGAAALILSAMAACSYVLTETPGRTEPADPRDQELRDVLAEAEPLLRNLLSCLDRNDYQGYRKDFAREGGAAMTPDQFRSFRESVQKKFGLYEEGGFQVNKIESYTGSYRIYYFVKFRSVDCGAPAIVLLQVKKAGGRLAILNVFMREYEAL